jgi:hypothetical protein
MGGNGMKRAAIGLCLLLAVAVALVAQTGKHRKLFSAAPTCTPGPVPQYLGSTSASAFIVTTDTLSYSSSVGSLLILGSINDSGGTGQISNVTDSAGNTWHSIANNPPLPDFWETNAAAAVTNVTVAVSSSANYKLELGEYSHFTTLTNAQGGCNNCNSAAATIAGYPVAGFIDFAAQHVTDPGSSFTGPYAGGTVRQSLNFGTGAGGLALLDNISSVGTISERVANTVFYTEAFALGDHACHF